MKPTVLEEGETLLRESNAALQTSFFLPKGGKLILTNKRLVFLPSGIFAFYKVKPRIINIADIEIAERGDTTNLLAGSLRKRLSIRCKGKEHIFLVRKLDEWVQAIKKEGDANVGAKKARQSRASI